MRKVAWENGQSVRTIPVKHSPSDYELATSQVSMARSAKAVQCKMRGKRPDRPLIIANPRRDTSRKYVRQSGGYVTSGWRQG